MLARLKTETIQRNFSFLDKVDQKPGSYGCVEWLRCKKCHKLRHFCNQEENKLIDQYTKSSGSPPGPFLGCNSITCQQMPPHHLKHLQYFLTENGSQLHISPQTKMFQQKNNQKVMCNVYILQLGTYFG